MAASLEKRDTCLKWSSLKNVEDQNCRACKTYLQGKDFVTCVKSLRCGTDAAAYKERRVMERTKDKMPNGEVDFAQTTFIGMPRFETATVLSWIKDHPSASLYWLAEARKVYIQTRKQGDPVLKLAELLELWHLSHIPTGAGVYGDLIKAALQRVSWRDVALDLLAML